jgi:hypothetical protein
VSEAQRPGLSTPPLHHNGAKPTNGRGTDVPHRATDVPQPRRVRSAIAAGSLRLARCLHLMAVVMDRPEVAWVVSAAMGQRHDVVDLGCSAHPAKPNAFFAATQVMIASENLIP